MKTGIELIAQERQEQIEKHGYNKSHDKKHDGGNLALNASILASPQVIYEIEAFANSTRINALNVSPDWKLPHLAQKGNIIVHNSKLGKRERIKQLIVAGALICAEIDRINVQKEFKK